MKFFAWPLGLWLAARRSLRGGAPRRRRSAAASLLLVLPFTTARRLRPRRSSSSAAGFDQDAYTIFGLVVQAGGSETGSAGSRRFAAGAALLAGDVALPQLHAGPRRRARPLPDRLARLLRGRGRAARHRPAAALARSGSSRSRRGGCRAPASGSATPRARCGCWSSSRSCSRSRSAPSAAQGSPTAPIASRPTARLAHEAAPCAPALAIAGSCAPEPTARYATSDSKPGAGRNRFARRSGSSPRCVDQLRPRLTEEAAGLHQVRHLLGIHPHEARAGDVCSHEVLARRRRRPRRPDRP